jgi:hypothetical protein
MSNRSLVEFNHDFSSEIERDPHHFVEALVAYLRSASPEHSERLRLVYGVTVFGTRHHSDDYSIKWGSISRSETSER